MNGNSNIIIKLGAVVFLVIGIFTIARLEMKYNDIQFKCEELEAIYEENEELMDDLERELGAEYNEEYIIKIAREKLNLCMPEEIIFYNDLTE